MPVLVALNAADTAMEVAQLTDEEAVAEAMAVSGKHLTGEGVLVNIL